MRTWCLVRNFASQKLRLTPELNQTTCSGVQLELA